MSKDETSHDEPEMQGFRLCSPPRSPSSLDPNEDLLVIELGEKKKEKPEENGEPSTATESKKIEERVEHQASGSGSGGGDEKPVPSPPAVGFGELFRFADGLDLLLMAIGTAGAVVHGCSLPVFLRFFADLVDSFGSNADDPVTMCREVVKYAFYFLVVGAAIWASSWAEISCWMWTGERQTTKMRIRYLESALNQDVRYFDTEVRTSDVIYAVNADAVTVQDAISEKLGNFIHYMGTFVSGFIIGFTAVWQLALVTLAVVPVIAVIGGIHATSLAKLSSKSQGALSQASNIAEQALAQIRTVQSFVGETRALQAYSSALRIAQRIGYRTGLAKGLGLGATYFTVFCCYALLLWYGGLLVRHHHTNGGLAIATMFSVMLGGIALGQSAPSMSAFAKARVAAAKIYRTIDHKPAIERSGDPGVELDSVTGHVELRNVEFAYPSRPEVLILRDFSLNVAAGKTMALVGSSGSGKSTVVALIERFYDPISGEVMVDGRDIKTMKLRWLRQQIGLVSQEPALFATTIRENLLLGREDATQVEIEEAARVANAHSFIIKLPDGYDSQVGDRGLQLSGGQKQRIAIARAMLKNPAILLLDEATSALDSESEKLVQEALDRFMIGRTTLVIAHRLSTIRKADTVAVLHQGSVSEIGTHDELMAKGDNGMYAKLIRLQEQAHETAMVNARKSSARPSSARPSISSPIMTRNSSYGRSPYSRRLSDFSTSDFSLTFDPNHRMEKLAFRDQASSFWRLAKMNSPEWAYALIGSIGSMVCGSISALFAYVLSAVLSIYYSQDYGYMKREIAKYCYLLIGVSSAALLFNTVQHMFWDVVGENLTKRVREKMLSSVLRNEMAWFDQDENSSARMAARLSLDAHNVRSAIGDRISVIVQNAALLVVACTAGFVLQWRLALVLIAVFPVVVAATVLQKMFMKGFSGDLEAAHAKATQIASEAVANVRTVAAFNSESKITQLFAANLEAPLRRCFWKGQIAGSCFGIAQFLLYASYSLGLWYAAYLVKHGISDFSKTIRVFMVLMVSANGAAETLTLASDFIKGGRAMKSVFEIIDRKTEIEPDDPDASPLPEKLRGEVELKHVDFSYPTRPDFPVLRDLTIRARAGRMLALVGPSGCGKSSVISLIQRFYEPNSGRVLIDGKDIRKYNLWELRRSIAVVPQEPCLFALKRDAVICSRDRFWILQELVDGKTDDSNDAMDACSVCLKGRGTNIVCHVCQRSFHPDCMGVSGHDILLRDWSCHLCACKKQLKVLHSSCNLQKKDNGKKGARTGGISDTNGSTNQLEVIQQILLNYLNETTPQDDSTLYTCWFYICLWFKDDPQSEEKVMYYLARLKSKAILRDSGSNFLLSRNWAKKICLALGQHSSFSRGFDTILALLLASMKENSPVLRAKALRAVSLIVEADPEVLCDIRVQSAVEGRFCDSAISAREAALELVGRHIASHPDVGLKYFEKVAERIKDTGVSVRKRSIKIIRDLCTSHSNFPQATDAFIEIISRVSDEESGIQDLVCKTFYEFWFEEPSGSQTQFAGDGSSVPIEVATKTEQIVDVLRRMHNHHIFVTIIKRNLALDFLPQAAKAAGINAVSLASVRKRCELICKRLLERILQVEERNSDEDEVRALPYVLALHAFCLVDPMLCAPATDPSKFVVTLQPYLKHQVNNKSIARLLESIIFVIDAVLPLLRKPPPNVIEELQQDLKNMIMRHSFLTVVHACIRCLCSLSKITGKGASLVENLIMFFFKKLDVRSNDSKLLLVRSLFCIGLLIRYGNGLIDACNNQHPHITKCLLLLKKYLLMDDFGIKVRALQALGYLLIARPEFMLDKDVGKIIEASLSSGSDSLLKMQVLQNIYEYLLDAESQLGSDDHETTKNVTQYPANAGNSVPVAAGAGDTNICGGIIQLYWNSILDICLDVSEQVRLTALKIVEIVLRQGLVHPITCVPCLVALETDPLDVNSKLAHHLLMNMNEKYPAFFESRLGDGLQLSFRFMQSIMRDKLSGNLKGKPDGNTIAYARPGISRIYRLIRANRNSRNKFMHSIVRKFESGLWTCSSIPFLVYCTEVLAALPFTCPDEPLYLIYDINRVIQLRAGGLEANMKTWSSFSQLQDSVQNPNATEKVDKDFGVHHNFENNFTTQEKLNVASGISEEDLQKFQADCHDAIALQLLLKLKRHLKIVYGLNDSRCQAFSLKEHPKPGETISRQNIPFSVSDTPISLPTSYEDMVQKYQEFKATLKDDTMDYTTYTSSVKRKRQAAPRSSSKGVKPAPRARGYGSDDDDTDDEEWTGGPRKLDFSGQKPNGGRVTRQRLQV